MTRAFVVELLLHGKCEIDGASSQLEPRRQSFQIHSRSFYLVIVLHVFSKEAYGQAERAIIAALVVILVM